MIVRIYTGHDGQTHFEDLPLPAEENYNVALQAGANLVFRCFPADYWSDWHTAPRRQYFLFSWGRWKSGSAMAPRAVLDRVMWSSLTTSQARATRRARWEFRGSVPPCRCGRLTCFLPPSTYEDTPGHFGHCVALRHRRGILAGAGEALAGCPAP
jgi:hypothetical protein